jgi:hypothetical protein
MPRLPSPRPPALVAAIGAISLASGPGAAAGARAAGEVWALKAPPRLRAAALLALPLPLAAAPSRPAPGAAPICPHASHERLLPRTGRDVCGATLGQSGRPTAAGFMPTTCPSPGQIYTIDADGIADRCVTPPRKEKT